MDLHELLQKTRGRRSLLQALGVAAVGISFGGLAACSRTEGQKLANGEEARLNFYNWDTYIGEDTLSSFRSASGVDVTMDLFDSNDVLFAKFKAGNPGYDVIVPSNDFVERMVRADMLLPIDHSKVPNFTKNIEPAFQDVVYDPGRKFSMPYTWLALGIGYRKSKVTNAPNSWKTLFDSDQYKGRIAWLSEAGDMFRLFGKYLGKSVNELNADDLRTIEAMMIRQKPNVKKFHEDDGQDLLLKGDCDLVLEYNGDIAQIMREDDDIGFIIPKEGSQLNSDNLCIPKGAPHPQNAHAFINYLLDAEVGKHISETILFPTPNAAAKALMAEDYRSNPVIFPTAQELSRCEYARFNPDLQSLYEEAFTRVRAS
jgi:spermidine/putrescine transport system substrate-binding protein